MFGLIADAHLRGKDWEDKRGVMQAIASQMDSKGVKVVFNLGDLFDNFGRLNDKYVTTNTVAAFLNDWLSSQDVTLISIEGNHDQSGQESAYDVFQHPKQIVIKNRVAWVAVDDHYFICVPWLTNNRVGGVDARMYAKEMIRECYADVQASIAKTGRAPKSLNIIGHLDAVGAKIREHVSITSEEYSKYAFDFENLINNIGYIDNVFLGHIHKRQPIKARGEGHYGYIGYVSPLGHGETEHENGWVLFDGNTVEFVDVDAPRYYQMSANDLEDRIGEIKHWDRVRIIGSPTISLPTDHVEVIGERLEVEAVREYIENKNTSLEEIYLKWSSMVGVAPKDPERVLNTIRGLNVGWESLTGKLTRLLSVEIENIGPHAYLKQEFKGGFTSIVGPNSVGKSFLLESFPFTIFGDWPTKRGSASSYMNKDSKLTVKFEIDGTIYYAVRTEKGLTAYDENMKDLTGKLKRSSRDWLEDKLGEKDNFLHCCFADQKSNNDLIDCDPSSRMHMLRAFLKLDVFDAHHASIKEALTKCKSEYDRHGDLHDKLSDIKETLQKANQDAESLDSDMTRQIAVREAMSAQLAGYQSTYQDEIHYSKVYERHQGALRSVELATNKLTELDAKIGELQGSRSGYAPLAIEGHTLEYNKLTKEYQALQKKMDTLNTLEGRVSKVNLDTVGCAPAHLDCILINHLILAKAELDALKAEGLKVSLKATQARMSSIKAIIDRHHSVVNKVVELRSARQVVEQDLKRGNDALSTSKLLLEETPKPTLKIDFHAIQKAYDNASREEVVLARKHATAMATINHATAKIAEYTHVIHDVLPELELQLDTLMVLEKAFSKYGIPHYMASSALPELQEIFDSLIKVAFEDRLHIVFDNISDPTSKKVKENFSIIKMNARRAHDVRYCSPGEQSILKTLWKLTLLTFQARRNEGYRVLFLDEPTTSQDAANIEDTMKVLRYVSGYFDQVIMVTHDSRLSELADNQIVLG